MKKIIILFSFLFFLSSFSQKIEKLPLRKFKIATLSDSLRETSGLTFFNGKLFTFNDSGNPSTIFEIDKNSGKILKKFNTDFSNKDWEAITNDGENIYIGDFGNNAGKRKDLKIFKINFKNLDSLKKSSAEIVLKGFPISFNYKEQKDFSPIYLNHDFDAESMFFMDGKIHLITKEWFSKKASHYIIDQNVSENQEVEKLETYDTGFVVTDASYFQGKLYVVGYTKKARVYFTIFEKDENGMFFTKTAQKYKLGSALKIGQVEGIAVNQDGIYISNEEFRKLDFGVKQSLYFIPFEKLK